MFKDDYRMNEISPGNFSCDICNLLIDIRHDDNPDERYRKCYRLFDDERQSEFNNPDFLILLKEELESSKIWNLFTNNFKDQNNPVTFELLE